MGILRNIAIVVLTLSILIFVALFGRLPALRNTPIGVLHRILLIHIPKACREADNILTGGRATHHIALFGNYLLHENHPVIMIIWLTILTSAVVIFLSSAWPRLATQHYLIIPPLVAAPYIFTYLCATSTASVITPASHARQLAQYPYDHVLYHPGNVCRTCHFDKPARSKHCPLCKVCVARHDHHCVWVVNCLGRANYRWFLALLASLGVLLAYGAWLGYALLRPAAALARASPRGKNAAFFAVWAEALRSDVRVGAVGLLALLTCPLAFGLLAYHVYLLWAGMTTNETAKWDDLRDDMAEGIVWRGRRVLSDVQRAAQKQQWPLQSEQVVVHMSDAVAEPAFKFAADGTPVEGWERCWRLAQVANLYDLGLWETALEVCFAGI